MIMKLGKLPPRIDRRTLKLSQILRALPPPPEQCDNDLTLPVPMVDSNMYANDRWGDCVIAGRAHQTLRFEDFEQKFLLAISDQEVLNEYWREGGATPDNPQPDSGLVMLDSLNWWCKGWTAAGQNYNIYAYAQIDQSNQSEVEQAVYLLRGAYVGIKVYESAMNQFQSGQIWDVSPIEGMLLGGHCIYIVAYNSAGLTCMTWGVRQVMTWAFFNKYCDESYAIVDNRDKWLGDNSPVDVGVLDKLLFEIAGQPSSVSLGGHISGQVGPEAVTIAIIQPDGQQDILNPNTNDAGDFTVIYTPLEYGGYTATASVAEDSEYLAASSPIIQFEV